MDDRLVRKLQCDVDELKTGLHEVNTKLDRMADEVRSRDERSKAQVRDSHCTEFIVIMILLVLTLISTALGSIGALLLPL